MLPDRARNCASRERPVSLVGFRDYRADPPESFCTASKGSSQRLANGKTLIADSDNGRAFEVTRSGEIAWEFYCPHEVHPGERAAIVRAIRFEPGLVDSN
jgi:hypothetical protein